MEQPIKKFSVKSYLTSIKRRLSETPQVWVHGVITEIKMSKNTYFLTIADFDEGSVKPVASLPLVCFYNEFQYIQYKAENASKPFNIQAQIKVCFLVKADLYITSGRFSAHIIDIDPIYTIGELAITRQMIMNKLIQEGLIDKNKNLEKSIIPINVGLITGINTAAYRDFATRLNESPFAFKIYTEYAIMQGNDTEKTIIQAIDKLNKAYKLDVICIVRGGGAKTDLNYFDSEQLCRAIANCPSPIFTGIGHEIDKSLMDEVAFESCITPTDCAKKLIEICAFTWQDTIDLINEISVSSKSLLSKTKEGFIALASRLNNSVIKYIHKEKSNLAVTENSLKKDSYYLLTRESEKLKRNTEGIHQGTRKILDLENAKFDIIQLKVKNVDPKTNLSKGYTLTLDKNGKFIKNKSQIKLGDFITTRLMDGEISSVVQDINSTSPTPHTSLSIRTGNK